MMKAPKQFMRRIHGGVLRVRRYFRQRDWPGPSIWKSWEQSTRTAGLASVGLPVFASGEAVNPWSLAAGVVLLILNVYIAGQIDRSGSNAET